MLWKGWDGMAWHDMDGGPQGFAFGTGVEVVDGGGLVAGQLAPDLGIGTRVGQFGDESAVREVKGSDKMGAEPVSGSSSKGCSSLDLRTVVKTW